ncbi:MAG: adenylosuccinate synthase [Alphaproteobacteria bacterium]|nr:adenylosuccinate synthase [Alphaproteobacteria bacterium]
MNNIITVGAQWGDEGKGKIVDFLSAEADWVVRFQGGANAGHTLCVDDKVYKLSLVPSGVIAKKPKLLVGSGVVIDPESMVDEITRLIEAGLSVSPERLRVSAVAGVILPIHKMLDEIRETKGRKIGTTGRGIGPAYEDRVGRRGIRMGDLLDPAGFEASLEALYQHHLPVFAYFGLTPPPMEDTIASMQQIVPRLAPYIEPSPYLMFHAQLNNARVLYEGAQGAMLDVDYGTYPYVTSSSTLPAQALMGGPASWSALDRHEKGPHFYRLGVTKAYSTRVGEGPMPSQLDDAIGESIATKGAEFGTVTGRARRCGWIDLVALRYVARLGGLHGLAVTRLDILDGFEQVGVCVGYEGVPRDCVLDAQVMSQAKPIFRYFEGWDGTANVRHWHLLPKPARKFLEFLAVETSTELALVSTGPTRESTMVLSDVMGAFCRTTNKYE